MKLEEVYEQLVQVGIRLKSCESDLDVYTRFLENYRFEQVTKKEKRSKIGPVISAPAYCHEALDNLRLCCDRLKKELMYLKEGEICEEF